MGAQAWKIPNLVANGAQHLLEKEICRKRKSVWKIFGSWQNSDNKCFGLRILGHKEDKLWVDDSGSISFQSPPKTFFSLASLLFCAAATLLRKSNRSLIFLDDTFLGSAHFVIMDFLRKRTGKQFYMKFGTSAVKGINLHKFSFPIPVLYVSAQSGAPISWVLVGGESWQDNRLPSTRIALLLCCSLVLLCCSLVLGRAAE